MNSEIKILVETVLKENENKIKEIIGKRDCYYHNKCEDSCFKVFDSNLKLATIRLKYREDLKHGLVLLLDLNPIFAEYVYISELIDMRYDYSEVCRIFIDSFDLKFSNEGADL